MRVHHRDLLHRAYKQYAVGAHNLHSMEQVHGVFRGALEADAPIIVQLSRAAGEYANPLMLAKMVEAADEIYPGVVFSIHLDHGDEEACMAAIRTGLYSSVMIDASHEPFEENVAITSRVVKAAHAADIWVEAELGVLSGVEDDLDVDKENALLTDPVAAADFVGRTECDALAVAVGNSHGAYKHAGRTGLQMDRLAAIHECLPNVPLVLHGSSSVPEDEIQRINNAGGRLDADAGGAGDAQIREAVAFGVVKVNIATDARLIWMRVHREFFRDHPGEFDFMRPGRLYMNEHARYVVWKSSALGSAWKGAHLRTVLAENEAF